MAGAPAPIPVHRPDTLSIIESNINKWEKISSGYKLAESDVDNLSKIGNDIVSELRKLHKLVQKRNSLFTPKLKPLFPPWSAEDEMMFKEIHDELAASGEVESRKIHERMPHKDSRDVTRYLKNFKAREKRLQDNASGERPPKRQRPPSAPQQQHAGAHEDESYASDSEEDGDQYEGESDSDEEADDGSAGPRSKSRHSATPAASAAMLGGQLAAASAKMPGVPAVPAFSMSRPDLMMADVSDPTMIGLSEAPGEAAEMLAQLSSQGNLAASAQLQMGQLPMGVQLPMPMSMPGMPPMMPMPIGQMQSISAIPMQMPMLGNVMQVTTPTVMSGLSTPLSGGAPAKPMHSLQELSEQAATQRPETESAAQFPVRG